jgi:hypothetical protein
MNGVSKLGDFPIGSLESRAAARIRLASWNDSRKRMRIITNIPGPGVDNSRVHFGKWQKWLDNWLGQLVYCPHAWLKPGDSVPVCPDCGTPFKKTSDFVSMFGFSANCLDKHDPDPLRQNKSLVR